MPNTQAAPIHDEHVEQRTSALTDLHTVYDYLAGSVVTAAGARGYAGSDPVEAIAWLEESAEGTRVSDAAVDLWRTFFMCFRPDENDFEKARSQAAAEEINQQLLNLPEGSTPPPALVGSMLSALSALWHDRHHAISERLDALIADLGQHQAQLGTVKLSAAHRTDELSRIEQLVKGASVELGLHVPSDEPIAQSAIRLVTHYRDELATAQRQSSGQVQSLKRLMEATHAIAMGQPVPALPPEAEALLGDVRYLDTLRRDLEKNNREISDTVSRLEANLKEKVEQLDERDRQIADLSAQPEVGYQILDLYRQALAAWESGADISALAQQIHALERVIALSTSDQSRAVEVADRHLVELTNCLEKLHDIKPMTQDPKRYRRRMFGAQYEFKTIAGQIRALRDAGHDVTAYAERARWAHGVGVMAKHAPKLRQVFREMVSFVVQWRNKLGDPPPASISISVDGGSGIISLPAILASDLKMTLRRKHRLGQSAVGLVGVLEGSVAFYHRVLEQALDVIIPRPEAGKREIPSQALTRLATELAALANICEKAFSEVVSDNFSLAFDDEKLLADEHLLRMSLVTFDGACIELSALPNAPALSLVTLPGRGTKGISPMVAAFKERLDWLELLVGYRVVSTTH